MLTLTIVMAVVSVMAFLVTLTRVIGWRYVLKHATIVDVVFTVLLAFLFFGTLTGMLVAIIGGLVMAVTLSVARKLFEWKGRYDLTGRKHPNIPEGADPSEYTVDGTWVYNLEPYAQPRRTKF